MMGKPCFKDTRITVELILRNLGAGRSFADLLEAYPRLTDVVAEAGMIVLGASYRIAEYSGEGGEGLDKGRIAKGPIRLLDGSVEFAAETNRTRFDS